MTTPDDFSVKSFTSICLCLSLHASFFVFFPFCYIRLSSIPFHSKNACKVHAIIEFMYVCVTTLNINRYTFLLACRLFMSLEDVNHVAKFADPFHHLASGIYSLPIDLPGTPFNKAIKAANFIRKELLGIISQRKVDLAEGNASPTQDILSHMLLTCNEDGQYMNELDIADKILGLLIGGHDTASATCTFIVKYLAEFPHIYHRVYQGESIDFLTCFQISLSIKICLFKLKMIKIKFYTSSLYIIFYNIHSIFRLIYLILLKHFNLKVTSKLSDYIIFYKLEQVNSKYIYI